MGVQLSDLSDVCVPPPPPPHRPTPAPRPRAADARAPVRAHGVQLVSKSPEARQEALQTLLTRSPPFPRRPLPAERPPPFFPRAGGRGAPGVRASARGARARHTRLSGMRMRVSAEYLHPMCGPVVRSRRKRRREVEREEGGRWAEGRGGEGAGGGFLYPMMLSREPARLLLKGGHARRAAQAGRAERQVAQDLQGAGGDRVPAQKLHQACRRGRQGSRDVT